MKLRNLLTIALAAAFVFVAPITAKAEVTEGWQQESKGWWYQIADENGQASYLKDGIYTIEGKDYYFDENGWMKTGWIKDAYSYDTYYYEWDDNDNYVKVPCKESGVDWLYANKSGEIQYGWQKIDGEWYYFNIYDGVMFEDGTYEIYPVVTDEYGTDYDYSAEPTLYHFAASGEMTTGWYYHDYPTGGGSWYYSNNSGAVYTGWQKIGGEWYYFDAWGRMESSYSSYDPFYDYENAEVDEDGYYDYDTVDMYYFKDNGAMVTGWYNYAPETTYGDWVYCNSDGTVYDGWLKSGGKWYYFDDGNMRESRYVYKYKETKDENGNVIDREIVETYYVGRDGAMITGWYQYEYKTANLYSNTWMYANADGTIETQWVKSGKDWYFVDADGVMVQDGIYNCYTEGTKEPERKDYASEKEYELAREKWFDSHRYVFDEDGKMVTNAWYGKTTTNGTTWYYADANGNGYDGWIKSGGKWYYCYDGVMQRNTYVEGGYWVDVNGVWVK